MWLKTSSATESMDALYSKLGVDDEDVLQDDAKLAHAVAKIGRHVPPTSPLRSRGEAQ